MRSRRVTTWVVHRGHPGATAEDYQRRPPRLESSWSACGGGSRERPAGLASEGADHLLAHRPAAGPSPGRSPDRPVVAGRYRLLDQVGSGGMGSVWRAHDLRTGQDVALKVLGRHSSTLLARFVREQAVRVRHPHVVAPHGWAAEDDLVVLAMELVAGGSVADLLREHGPLDAGTCALLVEQLLLGLAAVHGAGLVHRDVKPANLLLEATGDGPPHLRLGDFGVAAPVADRRFTTVPGAIGTDGYMAPEQARGAPPEPTQDLYAVGRVALELITGEPPARQGVVPSHPLRPLVERLLVARPPAAHRDGRGSAATAPTVAGPAARGATGARPARARARGDGVRRRGPVVDWLGLGRGRRAWPAWSSGVCGCS